MALKTKYQKREEAAAQRAYNRREWMWGYTSRRIQIRKALYIMGYKVNYPVRKY